MSSPQNRLGFWSAFDDSGDSGCTLSILLALLVSSSVVVTIKIRLLLP